MRGRRRVHGVGDTGAVDFELGSLGLRLTRELPVGVDRKGEKSSGGSSGERRPEAEAGGRRRSAPNT